MSISIPQTQKALAIPAPLAPYALITRPVPTPGAGDVLVKVQSIGLNPAENVVRTEAGSWVLQEYPALTGTDGAGTVVKLGEGVIGWEVGDRVLFQGKALGGAGLVPFWADGAENAYKGKPIVVLGGSSAVGQFAIQIASYLGFSPIVTTASAHNADYLKTIGATHFVDRKADLAAALAQIAPALPIDVVFDAVHTPITQAEVDLLAPGGVVTTVWPLPEGDGALDLSGGRVAAYFYGSVHLHQEMGVAMYKRLTEFLERGVIKPTRVEKLSGGLGGIEEGLGRLDRKEVSGYKLVVSLAETPDV
ncbi:NAD(P)-binding protein [Athelia psychrophila]|uniref:NAD(P)-binding protein n=2 Tax=Athelia psychrophila TaxID=1759441 RepID=A0A165YN69_9AGAM|nr:NAD(P)-binding protein [Fibularhizoctonia sp. CBS 109695]